jgi:hypothetical protein
MKKRSNGSIPISPKLRMDLWNDGGVSRHIDARRLVVPRVLPAQQGRAILLSAVHELYAGMEC